MKTKYLLFGIGFLAALLLSFLAMFRYYYSPYYLDNPTISSMERVFCKEGKMLPSLFIVGGMKCGTTTLNRDLAKTASPKLDCGMKLKSDHCEEKHFFDNPILVEQGLGEYGKLFNEVMFFWLIFLHFQYFYHSLQ